jgi:UDP-N-acetylglucosamine 2-epimerase (non-hydrolysing)
MGSRRSCTIGTGGWWGEQDEKKMNMPMKRILILFGTRPEAIKLAPIIKALKETTSCGVKICVTAQHREMLDQVLSAFDIRPEYDLNIMRQDQELAQLTCGAIDKVSEVLIREEPDWVVVQGDTTTTFASALASFYLRIPVAHIEAGLRSGTMEAPWPEELNRKLTSVIARLHFAPTEPAKQNLLREGCDESRVFVTGNTVIDALFMVLKRIDTDSNLRARLQEQFEYVDQSRRLVLVTGHRRESFGRGFENICKALIALSRRTDVQIVYPLHLNPNVKEPVLRILGNIPHIHLVEPLEYVPFVYLMRRSYVIITDSGGIQEEAPSLGKPVLVMRDRTERPEAVDAGSARLVGTDSNRIEREAAVLLDDISEYRKMVIPVNPYGNGDAAKKIVGYLLQG